MVHTTTLAVSAERLLVLAEEVERIAADATVALADVRWDETAGEEPPAWVGDVMASLCRIERATAAAIGGTA